MQACGKVCMVLIGLIAYIVYKGLNLTDFLKDHEYLGPVKCVKMPVSGAPEDVVFIPNTRIALMGVDDRLNLWLYPGANPATTHNGGITAVKIPVNMDSFPTTYPVELKHFPKDVAFHPHGMYMMDKEVFVVNHGYRKGGERVEVFGIEGTDAQVWLEYKRSLLLPDYMLGISNDIVVLSPTELYISLWKEWPDSLDGRIETIWDKVVVTIHQLFGKRNTGVYHCKGERKMECEQVMSGVMANGLVKRGEELFVTDSVAKAMMRYQILPSGLKLTATYPIQFAIDNIEYDPETDLIYVGTISRAWDFLMMTEKAKSGINVDNEVIPGGCVEFNPKTGTNRIIVNQKRLSGVSACARKGMFIAMGSWHDPHVMICPMEDPK